MQFPAIGIARQIPPFGLGAATLDSCKSFISMYLYEFGATGRTFTGGHKSNIVPHHGKILARFHERRGKLGL
jgi:hypothetical protein